MLPSPSPLPLPLPLPRPALHPLRRAHRLPAQVSGCPLVGCGSLLLATPSLSPSYSPHLEPPAGYVSIRADSSGLLSLVVLLPQVTLSEALCFPFLLVCFPHWASCFLRQGLRFVLSLMPRSCRNSSSAAQVPLGHGMRQHGHVLGGSVQVWSREPLHPVEKLQAVTRSPRRKAPRGLVSIPPEEAAHGCVSYVCVGHGGSM